MTKQEAIDLIKLRLGSREDSDLDALITAELTASQDELEATAPYLWFCENQDARQLVVNTAVLAVPDDFIVELEERPLEVSLDNFTFTEVFKVSYNDLQTMYRNTIPGCPQHYALVNGEYVFGPTPAYAYYMRHNYQGRDTSIGTLAGSGTNKWLTHASDYLTAHVGMAVATWVKDAAALKAFGDKFAAAQNRLTTLQTAREEANRSRAMEA